MRNPSTQSAWIQAVLLGAAIVVIATILAVRLHRPFDRDTLAIQVANLDSLAAEAALLAREGAADHLAPGFVRQQVQQLADKVDSGVGGLQSRPALPGLDAARATTVRLGDGMARALSEWSKNAAVAQQVEPRLAATAAALDRIHGRLKPGT